jgi:hypothetical protein
LAVNFWSVTYFGVFNFGTSYLGMRDKDEHISALMERLKTVSKGYEQHKILHSDLTTMPESGYNTRMNEDQQLLTVEESKQILFRIFLFFQLLS